MQFSNALQVHALKRYIITLSDMLRVACSRHELEKYKFVHFVTSKSLKSLNKHPPLLNFITKSQEPLLDYFGNKKQLQLSYRFYELTMKYSTVKYNFDKNRF